MLTLGGKLLDFAEKTVTDRQNRCERRESRTDARRRSERRRFSSASDDDGGGSAARCASSGKDARAMHSGGRCIQLVAPMS
jgi:hypothetical protein